jgi:hypothetical protein
MSKFLKLTDKYDCDIAINKDLVDVFEDLLNGGARITSLKANETWDVKETTKQIMEQMEEE